MLNSADIAALERPFLLEEHGFRDGKTADDGKPYIFREALKRRLDEIDRGWSIEPHPLEMVIVGDVVSIPATLTIKGVKQKNVATAVIQKLSSDGTELSAYKLALNTAHAIKTATSGCLQRCLQWFGCALYLKSPAFKGISTRAALKTAIDKLLNPPHWAVGEGRLRIADKMKTLSLKWEDVSATLDPDKPLLKLSDTSLTESEISARLDAIALEKLASPARNEDTPFQVLGADLQAGDLIFPTDNSGVRRLMHILGHSRDGAKLEVILWFNSQVPNVVRKSLAEDETFTIKRFSTLKPAPADVLRQVEELKRSYKVLNREPAQT
jgi:hypothetical protein